VIAVIAAIAAVIVPSITNFNQEAKNTADKRNVQLWNQTYLEAKSAGANMSTATGNATVVNAISVSAEVGSTTVYFNSPGFTIAGNKALTFNVNAAAPLTLAQ